jgi:hypothetical protein
MKKILLASLVFAGLAAWTGAANAAPLGTPNATENGGWATRVAAIVCLRDDRGWHHMRGGRRLDCRPERPKMDVKRWGWRCEGPRCGWWHSKEKRWHDG